MNQSKDFFPELKALQFPELKALRDKMNAQFEPDLDIRIRLIGVPVTEDNFKTDNEIIIVENRKAVLYIKEPTNVDKYGLPKYHIVHCNTLRKMEEKGLHYKFHAKDGTDRKFLVKLPRDNESSPHELVLCKNCLYQVQSKYSWDVFPNEPEDFPLEDWLEPFFNYSSDDWKERSLACRERANWTCQECGINLESDSHFLHAHHKWGTKYDDPEDLRALCIRCHTEQHGDKHRTLKHEENYQEFMKKYGSISRSDIRFNLSNQRPQHTQGQSTPTDWQAPVPEEDIPF